MGETEQRQPMAAYGTKSSLSTFTNLIGAGLSLALLVGVGVWGYKLLMRDVSGVPVVRAAEGPMRVQPDNPGGEQALNQGLSVNNVAAEGTAADPADTLLLAPAPLELTVEDEATAPQDVAAQPAEPVVEPELAAARAETPQTEAQAQLQLEAVEELAARLADGVEPIADLSPVEEAALPGDVDAPDLEEEEVATEEEIKPVIKGGLKRSLRPKTRPTALNTSVAATADAVVAAAVADVAGLQDVNPDTIPVGTRLAQLGAYDSADVARAEWDRLNGRFAEYLEGKSRVIQKAKSGGRTFYRLRAMGFDDLSDARRFCSALVSEKAECIPVVTR